MVSMPDHTKKKVPESISRSILEVKPAKFILNEDISRPEIGVTSLKDVSQHLLLCCFRVTVALEVRNILGIENEALFVLFGQMEDTLFVSDGETNRRLTGY